MNLRLHAATTSRSRSFHLNFKSKSKPPHHGYHAACPSNALGATLVASHSTRARIVPVLHDRRDERRVEGDGGGVGVSCAHVFERVDEERDSGWKSQKIKTEWKDSTKNVG